MQRRKKLTNKELINHLEEVGVTFNNISTGNAINFLESK